MSVDLGWHSALLLKTSHKGADHSGMQILAAVWSVPFALTLDVSRLLLPRTTSEPNHWKDILPLVAVSGVFFGLYSWLGVATLQQVSPTSYSLGNTAKRAFLVLFLSWSEPVTVLLAALAALATYAYSLPKMSKLELSC